ncbi:MAG: tRNA 2-thiocytidine(32) synthetase TtcA [Methylococcales bacterium]
MTDTLANLSSPNPSKKEQINFNKLQKRLRRNTGKAIVDFNMIENGDRIMVCLSGGKDSYTMLDILINLRANAPIQFDLIAVNLDQKQPGFPEDVLPRYLSSINIPYHIIEQDTYSVVKEVIPENKTTCGLCSRMRRGILYRFAEKQGYDKIALGHHRDDILETFFLNLFYGGKLKAMPPKLLSDDKKHILIRPLSYCREKDIRAFADWRRYPIIPCNLCGTQENSQRKAMKEMLAGWERQYPGRVETIYTSLQNIAPSQLLDSSLFNFTGLDTHRHGTVEPEGNKTLEDLAC